MVGHHQAILEYSIIMYQIIPSFEIDTSCIEFIKLMNLLKFLILLKWMIYRNDYLTFYNDMDQKEVLVLLTWLFLLFSQ